MSQIAVEVAEAVQRAAELLSNAAKQISNCDCETLDQHALSKVVNELVAAETSARAIHACLRTLQSKHAGKLIAHASLETQPLDSLEKFPSVPKTPGDMTVTTLADEAATEVTGGQCC